MLLNISISLVIFLAGVAALFFMKRNKIWPFDSDNEQGHRPQLENANLGDPDTLRSWGRRTYDHSGGPKPPFAGRRKSDMSDQEASVQLENERKRNNGNASVSNVNVKVDTAPPGGSLLRVDTAAPSPGAQASLGDEVSFNTAEYEGAEPDGPGSSQSSDLGVLSERFTEALVFLNMGDQETAFSILEELEKSGNPKEKLEAARLLNR